MISYKTVKSETKRKTIFLIANIKKECQEKIRREKYVKKAFKV